MRADSHATGMAGEFFVMERLFRLGLMPALTLGNAKTVDVLVRSGTGRNLAVSVKSVRGNAGKWVIGGENYGAQSDLVFAFLLYDDFHAIDVQPRSWVMTAADVERHKLRWQRDDVYAIYHNSRAHLETLKPYENAWERYFR